MDKETKNIKHYIQLYLLNKLKMGSTWPDIQN